jgi:lipopolysaccharide export system permease protein
MLPIFPGTWGGLRSPAHDIRGQPDMQIIDRYLLRQFLQTFFICFFSLVGLFVIFDLFANLEQFIDGGRRAGGLVPYVVDYYKYKVILFFDSTGSTLALVSAMFTVSWIQRHNEMTALMAAGVSRIRVLTPIIVAVGVVSLVLAANREIVMPRNRHELARTPRDLSGSKPQTFGSRYDNRTGFLLGGRFGYADKKRIQEPAFRMPRNIHDPNYGAVLTADNAFYEPANKNHPGGYRFVGVHQPKNITARPSLQVKGETVLITPHDAPGWLGPNQCFVVSDIDFDRLTSGSDMMQLSSTAELIRDLQSPEFEYGAKKRVMVHARFVQPLLDMTLLLLGLPLVVSRENRNVFLAMGLCMVLTTAFTLVVAGSQALGAVSYGGISPALAAWMPLMIFVPLAAWLVESLWK